MFCPDPVSAPQFAIDFRCSNSKISTSMAISIDQMIRKAKNASKILDRINESLRVEFRLLEDEFAEALSSDTQLTHEVGEYLREARSKRLRAAMHMFAARACGYEGRNHIKIAAAVELIHLATLLHDDVIDNADHPPRTTQHQCPLEQSRRHSHGRFPLLSRFSAGA